MNHHDTFIYKCRYCTDYCAHNSHIENGNNRNYYIYNHLPYSLGTGLFKIAGIFNNAACRKFSACQKIHYYKQKYQCYVGVVDVIDTACLYLYNGEQKHRHQGVNYKCPCDIKGFIYPKNLFELIYIDMEHLPQSKIQTRHNACDKVLNLSKE